MDVLNKLKNHLNRIFFQIEPHLYILPVVHLEKIKKLLTES